MDEERIYRLYKKILEELNEYFDSEIRKMNEPPSDIVRKLSMSELSNLQSFIPQNMDLPRAKDVLELVQETYVRNSEKIGVSDAEKQRSMTIVERGARAEYIYWAGKNVTMAMLTTFIYATSVVVILEIVLTQAVRVMEVSGWSSLIDLINI